MLVCRDEVLALTNQLVQIKSIVNTDGEKEIAKAIYELIASFPYFQKHPDQVLMPQTVNDSRERYNVLAWVKGTKGVSNKTVILMGHTDTVGIEDYAQLQDKAIHPEQLLEALKQEADLPPLVQEHLHSGEWLFGRGVLDMKSGLASHLYLLKYFSEHPEKLKGNLVLVAECDEEDSSHGILSALKTLHAWRKEHHFDYVAAINADFVAPRYPGDRNRYIYKGTVGKLLPAFFITGAETHVGSCFEGLDPNFLAAELTRQINYNPELCNEAYGETTLPPVSLKQTDLKPSYTVQTALSAYVYYNFFIHSWSPKDVLNILKKQATLAFERALNTFKARYRQYCQLSGEEYQEVPWQSRVFTFAELNQLLIQEHGQRYLEHMEACQEKLLQQAELDIRMYSARVVEEAWQWMPDKAPAMVLFYASLYSPRVEVTGKNDKESKLLAALDTAINDVQPHYHEPIVTRHFFPYISDMSFVALSDDQTQLEAVTMNTPGWGKKLFVDYQDIADLNVPVINIGPYGYDGHKRYERMEMEYSLQIVPNLTYQVIKNLLG